MRGPTALPSTGSGHHPAIDAIIRLNAAFRAIGIDPAGVEIVMSEADAEKLKALAGHAGRGTARRSLCLMAGFLISGEPAMQSHDGLMADILPPPQPKSERRSPLRGAVREGGRP